MRFAMCLVVLSTACLQGQEAIENFRLTSWNNPYIGPDGQVLRSIEDNVTPAQWPDEKRAAYERYPMAVAMPAATIPMTASEAYALLKTQSEPIAIGHRWVKDRLFKDGPPVLRRVVLWLEPRPKHLNDEELDAAAAKGEFDLLFPPYPLGHFAAMKGLRLNARYVHAPIPSVCTRLTVDGKYSDPWPIECGVELYSDWDVPGPELIRSEIESYLETIGGGWDAGDSLAVVKTASGIILKHGGTQFGQITYRWVSRGNLFDINVLGHEPEIIEAFVRQQPSELPQDLAITQASAGMLMLQYGLERLRIAPSVIADDDHMIRIHPMQNRDVFGRGIRLLKPIKELWPIVFGYLQEREARYEQHLAPTSAGFSWQAYIDEETASRAKVLAAVSEFVQTATSRGLQYRANVSREPWEHWAEEHQPPCYELGPEK